MGEATVPGRRKREHNMARRRERILEAARRIIAESGFDALNVRALAERAGVTVPTIYNLIGNKSALVARLFDESISPFEHLDIVRNHADPVSAPEAFFAKVVATMREDEHYHRAEFLARERLRETGDTLAADTQLRIEAIAIDACDQLRRGRLIAGRIEARQLGRQIEQCVRLAYHDWAHGLIDLAAFERRVLTGTYICLAADATPDYHERFVEKLRALGGNARVIEFARK